jgi:hypothetical protein
MQILICHNCKRVWQWCSSRNLPISICNSCNNPKTIFYEFDGDQNEWETKTDEAIAIIKGEN